jgi:hypothetical protein
MFWSSMRSCIPKYLADPECPPPRFPKNQFKFFTDPKILSLLSEDLWTEEIWVEYIAKSHDVFMPEDTD